MLCRACIIRSIKHGQSCRFVISLSISHQYIASWLTKFTTYFNEDTSSSQGIPDLSLSKDMICVFQDTWKLKIRIKSTVIVIIWLLSVLVILVIIYETYLLLYCIILYIGLLPTLSIITGSVPSGMSVILLSLSAVSTNSLNYTQHYIYPHSLFHLHLLLLHVDLHSLHLL